jgi:hypothetical protein
MFRPLPLPSFDHRGPENQDVHLRPEKTVQCLLRTINNRLVFVEGGVQDIFLIGHQLPSCLYPFRFTPNTRSIAVTTSAPDVFMYRFTSATLASTRYRYQNPCRK